MSAPHRQSGTVVSPPIDKWDVVREVDRLHSLARLARDGLFHLLSSGNLPEEISTVHDALDVLAERLDQLSERVDREMPDAENRTGKEDGVTNGATPTKTNEGARSEVPS